MSILSILEIGISQIDDMQARYLLDASDPIPTDPRYHIVQLGVFHQLHCLVSVRIMRQNRLSPLLRLMSTGVSELSSKGTSRRALYRCFWG